ncbi:MAG TPA: DNA cytosine methyltransferase, partial [Longimicrobiaceae bacterium]|nr:DNA cytosine methyltransferase [Longimicrobiaceae bacterium]
MRVDLCAGAGGFDVALDSLGLPGAVGLEGDAAACATRAAAGHLTIRTDIATYPVEPFAGRVSDLIGGPPCQSISDAGKRAGQKQMPLLLAAVDRCRDGWTDAALDFPWSDPRTPLILQVLRWAWGCRPQRIAMEQVRGALAVWERMAGVLRGWGYAADARVLCAADYGVPQTRHRAFLLASLDRVRWPEPTHERAPVPDMFGPGRERWVTMAAALGWGSARQWVLRHNSADPRRPRGADGVQRARAEDGSDYYLRFSGDAPAPTLTGQAHSWVFERPAPTVVGSFSPDIVACPTGRR